MYKIIPVLLAMILMMNTECFRQNAHVEQSTKRIAEGLVQPIAYVPNGEDCTTRVSAMTITSREARIECRINFKGGGMPEYYAFSYANTRDSLGFTVSDVSDITLENMGIAYIDHKSHGTLTYDPATGIETLDVYIRIHWQEHHDLIRWKAFGAPFAGWTYRAVVNESCKRTTKGDIMIYTYCELQFGSTTVGVSTYTTSDKMFVQEEPEPYPAQEVRQYAWVEDKRGISIFGFEEYGILEIRDDQLVGRIPLGDGKFREVLFNALPERVWDYIPGQ